jgi:hypothetical protein
MDTLATKMYHGKRLDGNMKEPRTEKLVEELKETVERLNRLDALLEKSDVSYTLYRKTRDTPWLLEDVVQKVEY